MPTQQKMSENHSPFLTRIGNWLGGINVYLFFLLLFLLHVGLVIQGIDMLDEGFHVAGYQQIFKDPASVQYTFVYWLSNVIGGAIVELFPGSGLLGIRIAGALICTLNSVVVYQLLKKHISAPVLKLSLVLLALFIANDPKDIYYNNISAFLYIAAAYFLYNGITRKNNLLIFVGGVIIGVNMFTRLPNVLGLGIGVLIFVYSFFTGEELKAQVKKFLSYTAGCIVGTGAMIGLMLALGHVDFFVDSIRQLFAISSSASGDDGMNGAYGIASLLQRFGTQYGKSMVIVLCIISGILLCVFLLNYLKSKSFPKVIRVAVNLGIIVSVSIFSLLLIRKGIVNYKIIELFTGLSLFAALFTFITDRKNEVKLIALLGCYILLVHPFGSAVGIYTVAPYSIGLLFPFVVYFISILKASIIDLRLMNVEKNLGVNLTITSLQVWRIKAIGLAVILLACLNHIIRYPYFYDYHNRFEMTYSVNNKFMKGIYTSKARAAAINELLEESAKHIQPGDYVLAYDLIPMYHFWTETRPYLRNPCPWFYSSSVFGAELDSAIAANKPLPVVVTQSIKTIGDGSKWPEEKLEEDYMTWDRNQGRNKLLAEFLAKNGYQQVWKNEVFNIYIPGRATQAKSSE